MNDLSREIYKLNFTVHGLMESLSEFQLKKTVITKMPPPPPKITTRDFSPYISLLAPPPHITKKCYSKKFSLV